MDKTNNDIKKEIVYCEELYCEKDQYGRFLYISHNNKSVINLPLVLKGYKEWLLEKEIIPKNNVL